VTPRGPLAVGASAPPRAIEDISRTDFVRFAGASGDFNPIHHDDAFAQAMGYPSVFGHGMLTAGYLSSYLIDWVGPEGLRKLRFRFHGQLWPGDTVTLTGRVTRALDEPRVECELAATNQNGDLLVSAVAEVAAEVGAP
jgi:acyl dehydratase